jgi:LysR family transcriptional regulator, positive regulator for ilvC
MDIRALKVFLSVCETLSFTRTSEQLHMSLSAVSRSLQRLEESLGCRLLERDNRNVRLTTSAVVARGFARRVVDDWEQLRFELGCDTPALTGELSIYCSVTASHSVLAPVLERFRAHFPHVEILLRTGDQADAIGRALAGTDDIAVAALPDTLPARLEFMSLYQSPLVFIAPLRAGPLDDLLPQERAGADIDWARLPFIVPERGATKERLDGWFRHRRLRPRIYAQVAGHEAIVAMVALGLGVGVVPEVVLAAAPGMSAVRRIAVDDAPLPLTIGLCALRQRLDNPLVRALWDCAR